MLFASIVILLFVFVAVLAFVETEKKDGALRWVYVAVGLSMVLICGFKPYGSVADIDNYLSMAEGTWGDDLVEPTFIVIAAVAKGLLGGAYAIFIIYACIGIPLKLWAISRIETYWFYPMLVWLSYFFLLQDLTQVRASLATAWFLVGLVYLLKGHRRAYLLSITCASFFHISSLVLFPLVLLGNGRLTRWWKCVLMAVPMVGFAMGVLHFNFLMAFPIPFVQEKLELYEQLRDAGTMEMDTINIFNLIYLLKMAIFYFLLWKYDVVRACGRETALLLKVFALSLLSFSALSFMPVLAFRISDLFGFVELLLFPCLIYTVRPRWVGKLLLTAFLFIQLTYNIFVTQLIRL